MCLCNHDSDDIDFVEPLNKKKRTHKVFQYERTFENKNDAMAAVNEEETWSEHYKSSAESGIRAMMRCNKVKYRGDQCSAGIYLQFDATTDKVHLFRALNEHDHHQKMSLIYEMPPQTKQAIKEMFDIGVTKPKIILNNLMIKRIELPDDCKFKSYLKELRDEKFGATKINLAELKQWLQDNLTIPEDKSKPFVVDFNVNLEIKNPFFRFFVSTKLLLANAASSTKIHADGTYKLIWQGYPILQVGTTDMHRSFHPFGLCVCTSEKTDDYAFMFSAVKKGLKDVYKIDFNPDILISDAANSISNGFEAAFGKRDIHIMCWAHMRRNVSDNVSRFIKNKKQQNEVLLDVDKLQLSQSHTIFDKAAKLFIEKYEKVSTGFSEYFETQWLSSNRYWYEGAKHQTPSHNNALECANRLMKDEHTLRERFELGKFRVVLFTMIEKWSLAYVNGEKELHNSPEINLEKWTDGYNWAKSNAPMHVKENATQIFYKIPARIDENEIAFENEDWNSFDEFKTINFKYYNVSFAKPFTKNNWHDGKCDCATFFKTYTCEHVIGISLRMKFIKAPDEAKVIPLGQKRKRGRPAKAKGALVVQ